MKDQVIFTQKALRYQKQDLVHKINRGILAILISDDYNIVYVYMLIKMLACMFFLTPKKYIDLSLNTQKNNILLCYSYSEKKILATT